MRFGMPITNEDISFGRHVFGMSQDTVLSVVCRVFAVDRTALYQRTHNNILRSMAAQCLCQWSGCTQHEVGKILEIGNSSSVSKRLKQLDKVLQTDKQVKQLQSDIDRILNEKQIGQVTLEMNSFGNERTHSWVSSEWLEVT